MILAHIFIHQHKAIYNLNIPINGNFDCFYQNRKLKLRRREDTTKYYDGHHCSALIGPNGVGKSTILEVLELLAENTDSRALVVFYDGLKSQYTLCGINMGLEDFSKVDADTPYAMAISNVGFLAAHHLNLVKINNLQLDDGLLSRTRPATEKYVHELTARENLRSPKRRKQYFTKLLDYFSNSDYREPFMDEIAFAFAFSGSSSAILQGMFNRAPFNDERHLQQLREWQAQARPKTKFGDEVSHGSIYQSLVSLNALSILSALMTVSNVPKSDFLPYLLLEYIDTYREAELHNGMNQANRLRHLLHRMRNYHTNSLVLARQNISPNINLDFDVDSMLEKLEHILSVLADISETLNDHCFDGELFDLERVVTTDYDTIQDLTDMVNSLPGNIASNITWGWRGISSGELARIHIFAELHAYLTAANKYSNNIILIDEADLYLHPEWQRTLLHDLLQHLVSMKAYGAITPAQIIICTHSPIIVSDFLPENIVSLTKNDYGHIEVRESFGFGNTIGDIYMNGMHLTSTFGEHARLWLERIIARRQRGTLDADDIQLIDKIPNIHIKNFLRGHE